MHKTFNLALAAALSTVALVGCGGGQNEAYKGAQPGIACEKAYSAPANVARCKQAEGRH